MLHMRWCGGGCPTDWLVGWVTQPLTFTHKWLIWTWAMQHCEIQWPSTLKINVLQCRPRRIVSERLFFPDPEAWWAAADWDIGAEQVSAALTRSAWGDVGIWPQWLQGDRRASGWSSYPCSGHITILIHPLSLGPPQLSHLWQATKSRSHSNGQACDALGDLFLTEFLGVLSQ